MEKQGDSQSLNLFNALLQNIVKKVNWASEGIKMDGKLIYNLRFSDDLALVSKRKEEIKKILKANTESGL